MGFTYSSWWTRALLNFHRPGPRFSPKGSKESLIALWSVALEAFACMFTTHWENERETRKIYILEQTFSACDSYENLNSCGNCFRKMSINSNSSITEISLLRKIDDFNGTPPLLGSECNVTFQSPPVMRLLVSVQTFLVVVNCSVHNDPTISIFTEIFDWRW